MNRLSLDERAQILAALVEGNSIRSVCRMLGREKRTVTRLLVDVGKACYRYQDRVFRNLTHLLHFVEQSLRNLLILHDAISTTRES